MRSCAGRFSKPNADPMLIFLMVCQFDPCVGDPPALSATALWEPITPVLAPDLAERDGAHMLLGSRPAF